jgi:signal transduction histidine kinase/streptogramin lyase
MSGTPNPNSLSLSARISAAIVLLSFVALAFASHAERTLFELEHTSWTLTDGAPGQIGAITQTPDGYLWLGSGSSLYRFDGVRFVRFAFPDAVPPGVISSLLSTANGELWVGIGRGGIARIAANEVRSFGTEDGLPGGIVYGLASDRTGGVWAATAEGLARWDGSRWQQGAAFGFDGRKVHAIFVARDETVWASADGQIVRLSPGSNRFEAVGVVAGWVARFAQAPDGTLWIAERDGGPVRPIINPDGHAIHSPPRRSAGATGVAFDRSGALWFSTLGDGIRRIARPQEQLASEAIDKFAEKDGLTADYTTTLFEDRTGTVWVGTSAGLDRFRNSPLVRTSLPSGTYNLALAAAGDGGIWIGSSNRPVMRLHDRTLTTHSMPPPIGVAHSDLDGVVWMGGPAGIWRSANDQLVKVTSLPVPGSSDLRVRVLVHDKEDRVWVAIEGHGLLQYRNGRWNALAPPTENPLHAIPVIGNIDSLGRVWFGYRDNLLVRIDPEGTTQRWTPEQGLDIGHVTAIAHGEHRTWIGGLRGLAYLHGDRVMRLRVANGDDVTGVHGLIEGENGELWAHGNAGLIRFSADEISRALGTAAFAATGHLIRGISLLTEDPVMIRPLPTAIVDAQARIWLSTNRGAVRLDYAQLEATSSAPAAHLESLAVDDVNYPLDGSAMLPARPARVTFRFTALDTHAPEQVRFRYRLDGYDENWQEAGTARQVSYTGLAPGAYRMQVAAANTNGAWGDATASAAFQVRAAFSQTKAFLALCIAAAALLAWTLYRIRLRIVSARLRFALEERHTERERIARELHDTLLQDFHALQLRFHSAARALATDAPARAPLEKALDHADEVLAETRDRVTELRTLNIIDLAETLHATGQALATERGIEFVFRQTGAEVRLGPFVNEEIYLVAREALMNALQHANPRRIEIALEQDERQFRLTVRDDGCGLPEDIAVHGAQRGHWGIRGMRERAARIGARLQIGGRPEGGTEVALSAPLRVLARYAPK